MTTLTARLADLAGGALLNTARVTAVSHPSPEFVRVALSAEAFRKATWVPGAKLQFRPTRGTLRMRTYTPVRWDTGLGVTELVAFTHGDGPAAKWFRRVTVGEACEVFGPRRSIDLRDPIGPVAFVGDESSVALAYALRAVTDDVTHVFEADDPTGLTEVLTGLGIADRVTVVSKAPDRAELLRKARDAAGSGPYSLVVTGDAATVHAVRRDSRTWPLPPRQVKGKAYWAEGRAGLD